MLTKHQGAEILLAGDKNDLIISDLINAIPGLSLVPSPPTHKLKTLDVIITTLSRFYKKVEIVKPLEPDNQGKPSGHKIIIYSTIDNKQQIREAQSIIKKARPMPPSKIQNFKNAIQKLNFEIYY